LVFQNIVANSQAFNVAAPFQPLKRLYACSIANSFDFHSFVNFEYISPACEKYSTNDIDTQPERNQKTEDANGQSPTFVATLAPPIAAALHQIK
jgi:hypothetical protein